MRMISRWTAPLFTAIATVVLVAQGPGPVRPGAPPSYQPGGGPGMALPRPPEAGLIAPPEPVVLADQEFVYVLMGNRLYKVSKSPFRLEGVVELPLPKPPTPPEPEVK